MSVKKTRRRYTKEFKLEAVQLARDRGGKVSEVANSLGIHRNILRNWIREYNDDPGYCFPGSGRLKTPDEELRQLKTKLREVEEERDILKKALAIFSKKKP